MSGKGKRKPCFPSAIEEDDEDEAADGASSGGAVVIDLNLDQRTSDTNKVGR